MNKKIKSRPAALKKTFDVVIIGAGPAGLTAGLFCRMRNLNTLMLDAHSAGGQMTFLYPTKKVHDYPSHREINAGELAKSMIQQTLFQGVTLREMERVEKIEGDEGHFRTITCVDTYKAKAVILAVGMGLFKPRRLNAPGEREYLGRGLCYMLPEDEDTRGKTVVCIGGGNASLEAALYCVDGASNVVILCKDRELNAFETYIGMIKKHRIKVIYGVEAREIYGTQRVEGIRVYHPKSKKEMDIPAQVIVVNIGAAPDFDLVSDWGVKHSDNGIIVDSNMKTSRKGVYACGDMVDYEGKLRLLVSASGEAAIAADSAYRLIKNM